MLALDDPRWATLQHAYGDAADIPDLLRALAAGPTPQLTSTDEPWFSLWSSLCHQGDVYTASYAAVPHIVRIAAAAPGPIRHSFFSLPAAIEVGRHNGRSPRLPPADVAAYRGAIAGLMDLACKHRAAPWDQDMLLSVAAAQAVAKGHIDVAEALMNLDAHWIARIATCDFD